MYNKSAQLHVNVLWSAVKDFENNFAPKKIT